MIIFHTRYAVGKVNCLHSNMTIKRKHLFINLFVLDNLITNLIKITSILEVVRGANRKLS